MTAPSDGSLTGMKRRKSLLSRSAYLRRCQASGSGEVSYVPPFLETDNPVIVRVYFSEEGIKAAIGNRETSGPQCRAQLFL